MFLSVLYEINIEFKILGGRIIANSVPFYVQVFQAGRNALHCEFQYPKVVNFLLTDESAPAVAGVKKPKFRIKGEFAS